MAHITEDKITLWNGNLWIKENGPPSMGIGYYMSFSKNGGKKVSIKGLKIVGVKSKEFNKVYHIAEQKEFPLGYFETLNEVCRLAGFDAIYSKEHGLMLLNLSLL